jgi:5-formyltetrahydrofolate cyclo-ligase
MKNGVKMNNKSGISFEKSGLRNKISAQREIMGEEEVHSKSARIEKRLLSLEPFKRAKSILFYYSKGNEVRTRKLIEQALRDSKVVVLPSVNENDYSLSLRRIKDPDSDLELGRFNIPSPKEICAPFEKEELDIIILPGIAFDMGGNRIGRGKGCYDRFLDGLDAPKVALAYEFQVVDRVPHSDNDIAIDFIITEERIIKCVR